MNAGVSGLVAKVTQEKSAGGDRFQCSDIYQLWNDGRVTIDHCIEDEEWGGVEQSRELCDDSDLPEDFFKAGVERVITKAGSMREEPLRHTTPEA